MLIKFFPARGRTDKLADAEIWFTQGPLAGLKVVGFGVWAARAGGDRSVSLPAREYVDKTGEKKKYLLVRAQRDPQDVDRLKDAILAAYLTYETAEAQTIPYETGPRR